MLRRFIKYWFPIFAMVLNSCSKSTPAIPKTNSTNLCDSLFIILVRGNQAEKICYQNYTYGQFIAKLDISIEQSIPFTVEKDLFYEGFRIGYKDDMVHYRFEFFLDLKNDEWPAYDSLTTDKTLYYQKYLSKINVQNVADGPCKSCYMDLTKDTIYFN